MSSLVDAIVEQLGAHKVARVRLEIGVLAGVAVDPLRFAFETCTRGTPLDGAVLEILSIPGRASCKVCGHEHPIDTLVDPCPCGSFDRALVCGNELRLKDVEVM